MQFKHETMDQDELKFIEKAFEIEQKLKMKFIRFYLLVLSVFIFVREF